LLALQVLVAARTTLIVSPDWACLADICLDLEGSPRKGTRLWAINQLAILEALDF
jgi:hypothetical protein